MVLLWTPVTNKISRFQKSKMAAVAILTSGSAMAEGPRKLLSVEILQLQNIPFEN